MTLVICFILSIHAHFIYRWEMFANHTGSVRHVLEGLCGAHGSQKSRYRAGALAPWRIDMLLSCFSHAFIKRPRTEKPFEPAYVVFWVHRMRWRGDSGSNASPWELGCFHEINRN